MKFFLNNDIRTFDELRELAQCFPCCILNLETTWNDYGYQTIYHVYLLNSPKDKIYVGQTKIGQKNMPIPNTFGDNIRINVSTDFDELPNDCFSLGMDEYFYKNIYELNKKVEKPGNQILKKLHDITFNPSLLNTYKSELVLRLSIMRNISIKTIKETFTNCFKTGDENLTAYDFEITLNVGSQKATHHKMGFHVKPDKLPQSNIHTLIGRNGVGKTHLFKKIISHLCEDDTDNGIKFDGRENISNVMAMSYSLFDTTLPKKSIENIEGIPYTFIGLSYNQDDTEDNINSILAPNNTDSKDKSSIFDDLENCITNSFFKNVKLLQESGEGTIKRKLLAMCIKELSSDPVFRSLEINFWFEKKNKKKLKILYNKLSSGHRTVLLSLIQLINNIENNSLVLIDEPELSLHPPLISSYIQAILIIVKTKNAVAFVATHSPVILQECSRETSWILERDVKNNFSTIRRPKVQTFGENIGILTHEVFKLEIRKSGYCKIIRDVLEKKHLETLEEVYEKFQRKLGAEAISLVLSLLEEKNE